MAANKLSHNSECFTIQLKKSKSPAKAKHCSLAGEGSSDFRPAITNLKNTLLTPSKDCKSMGLDTWVSST